MPSAHRPSQLAVGDLDTRLGQAVLWLHHIIRTIDCQLLGVSGERPENITYPGAAEPLQQVWIALRANERAVLEQVTLAGIVSGNLPETVRHLTENPSAWV